MIKVTVMYLNNEIKEHKPNNAEVTDGMLVMDWTDPSGTRRVIINTLNLAWTEVIKKH